MPASRPRRVPRRWGNRPFTAEELSRLLAAAGSLDTDFTDAETADWHPAHYGVPPAKWWSGFVLMILDTALSYRQVLDLPPERFDAEAGTLMHGPCRYRLHERTADALRRIAANTDALAESGRLFPWGLDKGSRASPVMLIRRYRLILYRAGLSLASNSLFERLRRTGEERPELLDQLAPETADLPDRGRPELDEGRNRQRRQLRAVAHHFYCRHPSNSILNHRQRSRRPGETPPPVFLVRNDSPRTLRAFFETRYRPIKLARSPEKSLSGHYRAIALLSWFTASDVTLDQLSDDLLEEWRVYLESRGGPQGDGYSPASVVTFMAAILAQWRYAWRKRLLDDLPRDVEMPAIPKTIPECWSPNELARILRAAEETTGTVAGLPAGTFWKALVLLLYDTGLRVGALLALRPDDVDLESGWLNVPWQFQKHHAQQKFPLHPETVDVLRATEPEGRDNLLTWPHSEQVLQKRYGEILERAGLPAGPREKFHKLRRTSGTFVADAAGVAAAQEHLGHSTLEMTRRHYLDPRFIRRRVNAPDVLPRPWSEDGNDAGDD